MSKDFKKTQLDGQQLDRSTQMTSYGYDPSLSEGAVKSPVFLTSTFAFETAEQGAAFFDVAAGRVPVQKNAGVGGLVYSRFNHPNIEIVEDRLALYDHAEAALITASGMAAIAAIMLTYLNPEDSIIHYTPLYGGTETLFDKVLPKWNIRPVAFANGTDPVSLRQALEHAQSDVKIVYLETPANPTNALIDIAMVREVVDDWTRKHASTTPLIVCDNTLIGPVFQQPLTLGVDICVYSLTKYVGGHSDLIAGGITGSKALLQPVRQTRSAFGFQLDPHSSWMLARSMETLSLRMERAAQTGRKVAQWIANNNCINAHVLHPEIAATEQTSTLYKRQCSGPGFTFSFVVANNRDLVFRILNALQIFKLAVSLGGTESLVCHPASTTHSGVPQAIREAAGITEGLIRLSIGLEHPDDLICDLRQAFTQATTPAHI